MDHHGNNSFSASDASLVNKPTVSSYDDFLLRMKLMFTETQRRISEMFVLCKSDLSTMEKVENSSHCVDVPDAGSNPAECLIISGAPYSVDEDLPLYCQKISLALGYQTSNAPVVEVKRLSRRPIPIGSAPLIQLKFVCCMDRTRFFNRYLSLMNLSLCHLGYAATRRIYVNEYLSTTTHAMRKAALRLKNRGRIRAVFVRNEAIFIQISECEKATPIYCSDQLNIFKNLSS